MLTSLSRRRAKRLVLIPGFKAASFVCCAMLVKELRECGITVLLTTSAWVCWSVLALRAFLLRGHLSVCAIEPKKLETLLGVLHAFVVLLFYTSLQRLPFLQCIVILHFSLLLFPCLESMTALRQFTALSTMGLVIGTAGLLLSLAKLRLSPSLGISFLNQSSDYVYAMIGFCASCLESIRLLLLRKVLAVHHLHAMELAYSRLFWKAIVGTVVLTMTKISSLKTDMYNTDTSSLTANLSRVQVWIFVGMTFIYRYLAASVESRMETGPNRVFGDVLHILLALPVGVCVFDEIPSGIAMIGCFLFLTGVVIMSIERSDSDGPGDEDPADSYSGVSAVLTLDATLLHNTIY